MWFSLAKMALKTGANVYSNKQKQKEAMSQAALLTAEKMARGETEYQGKLLEARQNDYKDEFVLVILSAPIVVLAWAVFAGDDATMEKKNLFFHHGENKSKYKQYEIPIKNMVKEMKSGKSRT